MEGCNYSHHNAFPATYIFPLLCAVAHYIIINPTASGLELCPVQCQVNLSGPKVKLTQSDNFLDSLHLMRTNSNALLGSK